MADIVVIGGGPAGSTAATLLARRGYSVTLLEKQKFPRFQIGESMLPYSNDVFRELGVVEKLATIRHVPKYGAEFVTGDGQVRFTFRFASNVPERYASTYQVTRADFDKMLLDHAREQGVEVREETTVLGADLSADGAKVRVAAKEGGESVLDCRFVVDASGHAAVLAQQNDLRTEHPSLRKIAVFAHYEGVTPSAAGRDAGNIVIALIRNGWFWMIPVSETTTSVGVVTDRDEFRQSGLQPETFLARAIEATPYVFGRMAGARRTSQVYARKDYSYRVRGLYGGSFAMAGDAAGFIDPIFSTGVFMAMKSATILADAVDARLRTGSMRPLEKYERRVRGSLELYLRTIESYYRREFVEVFLQPRPLARHFGIVRAIIGLLAGDVFENRISRWRMRLFFKLVDLQKEYGVIAPRLPWSSLPQVSGPLKSSGA